MTNTWVHIEDQIQSSHPVRLWKLQPEDLFSHPSVALDGPNLWHNQKQQIPSEVFPYLARVEM